jgi:hypothetical protein
MAHIDYRGMFALLGWVGLISYFFAKVEIHIEGKNGWAASLPTWRIEKHWLLDVFWGGRPLTGYHAWVFPFILLISHLGFFLIGGWTWELELRTMGVVALFWTAEDFLWFVLNPAFGLRSFKKGRIPWHTRWVLGMPIDYWVMGLIGLAAVVWTFRIP